MSEAQREETESLLKKNEVIKESVKKNKLKEGLGIIVGAFIWSILFLITALFGYFFMNYY